MLWVFLILTLPLYSLMAFTQQVLNDFKYFSLKYFVITAGKEKTHSTLRNQYQPPEEDKKNPKKNSPILLLSANGAGELIGCAELSNMLQCIRRTQGVRCYLEVRKKQSVLFFPSGMLQGGEGMAVIAVFENRHTCTPIEKVFRRK